MKKLLPAVLALSAAALALPTHAVTVVQWDFEGSTTPADLTSAGLPAVAASLGTGAATGQHASASTAWTTPSGNGSANALSSTAWAIGDYYQFSFATTGYKDMVLSFDQTGSNTGPRDFALTYSTNGVDFTAFADYDVLANGSAGGSWSSSTYKIGYTFSFDLSAISALDNQASVMVRLVATSTTALNGGTVASGGTNRIDNFSVTMAPVPEPETYALMLAGLVAVARVARRRKA